MADKLWHLDLPAPSQLLNRTATSLGLCIRPVKHESNVKQLRKKIAFLQSRCSSESIRTPQSSDQDTLVALKEVYVAGATGNTGRRIVAKLLSKGIKVRAGVRDIANAKSILPSDGDIEFVLADVTEGPEKLSQAIGNVDAVICATGFSRSFDPLAPWKVDNLGTVNLVDACRKNAVNRFVLISSILVNGAEKGQLFNPAYVILNLFGLTLIAKLQAENYIKRSGINYTIVRPGGLSNNPPRNNLLLSPEDTLFEGSISRDLVAEVGVEALFTPEASFKVVEIIEKSDAPKRTVQELFMSIA